MPNWLIALMLGAGIGGWMYSWVSRRTGGNTRTDAIVSAAVGFLAFLLMLSIMTAISQQFS